MKKILIALLLVATLNLKSSYAASMVGRLGIGMTNHIENNLKAFSIKLQRNRSTAIGGHFGLDSSSDGVLYAMGLKIYRIIYEEPQLNFYSALSGGLFSYLNSSDDIEQGYQFEGKFGTEFSFQGIESVGFSFEFGLGLIKNYGETHIKTIGHNTLVSAVHFYL